MYINGAITQFNYTRNDHLCVTVMVLISFPSVATFFRSLYTDLYAVGTGVPAGKCIHSTLRISVRAEKLILCFVAMLSNKATPMSSLILAPGQGIVSGKGCGQPRPPLPQHDRSRCQRPPGLPDLRTVRHLRGRELLDFDRCCREWSSISSTALSSCNEFVSESAG